MRRLNTCIYFMCLGARKAAIKTIKSIPECLADEIIACYREEQASLAMKKKIECEKNAKANR